MSHPDATMLAHEGGQDNIPIATRPNDKATNNRKQKPIKSTSNDVVKAFPPRRCGTSKLCKLLREFAFRVTVMWDYEAETGASFIDYWETAIAAQAPEHKEDLRGLSSLFTYLYERFQAVERTAATATSPLILSRNEVNRRRQVERVQSSLDETNERLHHLATLKHYQLSLATANMEQYVLAMHHQRQVAEANNHRREHRTDSATSHNSGGPSSVSGGATSQTAAPPLYPVPSGQQQHNNATTGGGFFKATTSSSAARDDSEDSALASSPTLAAADALSEAGSSRTPQHTSSKQTTTRSHHHDRSSTNNAPSSSSIFKNFPSAPPPLITNAQLQGLDPAQLLSDAIKRMENISESEIESTQTKSAQWSDVTSKLKNALLKETLNDPLTSGSRALMGSTMSALSGTQFGSPRSNRNALNLIPRHGHPSSLIPHPQSSDSQFACGSIGTSPKAVDNATFPIDPTLEGVFSEAQQLHAAVVRRPSVQQQLLGTLLLDDKAVHPLLTEGTIMQSQQQQQRPPVIQQPHSLRKPPRSTNSPPRRDDPATARPVPPKEMQLSMLLPRGQSAQIRMRQTACVLHAMGSRPSTAGRTVTASNGQVVFSADEEAAALQDEASTISMLLPRTAKPTNVSILSSSASSRSKRREMTTTVGGAVGTRQPDTMSARAREEKEKELVRRELDEARCMMYEDP